MERIKLLRTLLSFKTGFMRYNWYTKNLYMFSVYNFLTTVHFRVNKPFSSVTPFTLKVTCYKKLVWIRKCSWTHSNITKIMRRAKLSFSTVLMLILLLHMYNIIFQHFSNIVKDHFICISIFQKIFMNLTLENFETWRG